MVYAMKMITWNLQKDWVFCARRAGKWIARQMSRTTWPDHSCADARAYWHREALICRGFYRRVMCIQEVT